MKVFVEFSLHEYMDEFPRQQVRTWEGDTQEIIEAQCREWAKQMTELYSGGPTTFVKVWSFGEANEWYIKEHLKLRDAGEEDPEWEALVKDALAECYPKSKIFIGVRPY